MLIDLGDTFNVPNPTEEVRMVYSKFINDLGPEIDIVKLGGNHETRDTKIYAFESNFREDFFHDNSVVYVKSIYHIDNAYDYGCNLVFCNYGHQGGIQQSIKPKGKNILFAHLTVNGAKVNDNYTLRLNDGVNPKQYFEGYDYVFLGDIHKRQIQGNWRYIGALTKNNFGEAENKDGFSVITLQENDDKNINITEEFIEIPGRDYIKVEMTEDSGLLYTSGIEGSIFKIIVSGSSEWITTIDRQELIKKIEKLKPHRLSFEWNITDSAKRESISNNKDEQSQLEEYIETQDVDVHLREDGKKYLNEALINEGEVQ